MAACDDSGSNTAPKTLVITGVSNEQYTQGMGGLSKIGIFPSGTSNDDALSWTGLVAETINPTISGSTLTAQLQKADNSGPWTGSGTYDVCLELKNGSVYTYYRKNGVSFTSATTTIGNASTYTPITP
jgi:hypothetical protein